MNQFSWICCQIGAREHYSIPRSLYNNQQSTQLITDVWVSPKSLLGKWHHSSLTTLQERFHPDLAEAKVCHYNNSILAFELNHRLQRSSPWSLIMARNAYFQKLTVSTLKKLDCRQSKPILFAYSYAALDIITYAKEQGWSVVLGQIDPGPVEAKIVRVEHQLNHRLSPQHQEPPPEYWAFWERECHLADCVLVNSQWSKQALQEVGIAESKLQIVPLAYEPAIKPFYPIRRTYPERFIPQRPLRVLFLGQVILRKGIAALIKSAENLIDSPIEFWVVGGMGIDPPPLPNVRWIGSVARSQVDHYYQQADIFLFPTLSDGFGLTQLEAQRWNLPIIASQNCGEVVKKGSNGMILPEVSGEAITAALTMCLQKPYLLQQWSTHSVDLEHYSLSRLYHRLQTIANALV